MRTFLVLCLHLTVSVAKLVGPGGTGGLLAETLLLVGGCRKTRVSGFDHIWALAIWSACGTDRCQRLLAFLLPSRGYPVGNSLQTVTQDRTPPVDLL